MAELDIRSTQGRAEGFNLEAEVERLRAAIIKHRAQKADDRCWMDDDELYAVLGDRIKCDRRVGDKLAMLANCARFIERRCAGGAWPSYAELEAQLASARANGGWIPAAEIAPENCDDVLIVEEGSVTFGFFNGKQWFNSAGQESPVAWWQPIPRVPAAGDR